MFQELGNEVDKETMIKSLSKLFHFDMCNEQHPSTGIRAPQSGRFQYA